MQPGEKLAAIIKANAFYAEADKLYDSVDEEIESICRRVWKAELNSGQVYGVKRIRLNTETQIIEVDLGFTYYGGHSRETVEIPVAALDPSFDVESWAIARKKKRMAELAAEQHLTEAFSSAQL